MAKYITPPLWFGLLGKVCAHFGIEITIIRNQPEFNWHFSATRITK